MKIVQHQRRLPRTRLAAAALVSMVLAVATLSVDAATVRAQTNGTQTGNTRSSDTPQASKTQPDTKWADPDIARIVTYLNGIKTLQGRFVQIAPDGSVTQGEVYLRRPGRMRFKYDPPTPVLIVADGVWLVLWDKELDQVDRIPLSSTPLAFLIRDKVSFDDPIIIRKIIRQTGLLNVTVYDKRREDDGDITLVFSDRPLALRQWVVTDPQQLQTRVSLYDIETNVPLDIKLFVFTDSGPSIP
jgi:outer membrane lipoprotein-sorting protein